MAHPPVPRYNITDALTHLGADPQSIPTGPGWRRMSCPFHDDRTPSARVNHDLEAFMCFSCERKGDAVKILQVELRLEFRAALELAAELAGEEAPNEHAKHRNTWGSTVIDL